MGVYYMWVCPALKECLDPGNIPNGPEGSSGYGIKYDSIPYSSWGVAVLALDRWSGQDIRLVSDAGEGLYDEACEEYEDVWDEVLADGLRDDIIPVESMRFLAVESGIMRKDSAHGNSSTLEPASRETLRAALLQKFNKGL